jgi:hypothetical protein
MIVSNEFVQGYALVVGVANYLKVSKLPATVLNDARDLANVLQAKEYCAYPAANVELLLDEDATADRMRQGLTRLAEMTGPDDTALVFFSGHGGRIEDGDDSGTYLIPFDCDPLHLKKSAISSEELTGLFLRIRARRLVILLDACHAAGAADLKAIIPFAEMKAGLENKTYSALAEGAGRVIMASSRANEVSLIIGGMSNSVFTHFLLQALKGEAAIPGESVVRVFNVFEYVADMVPTIAGQHPNFKAHEVEKNFPLALHQGGKQAVVSAHKKPGTRRPNAVEMLDPLARIALKKGLVTRWEGLADYFSIPFADVAKFEKGHEPQKLLQWLEERNRLGALRDGLTYLGYDDLIKVLDAPQ